MAMGLPLVACETSEGVVARTTASQRMPRYLLFCCIQRILHVVIDSCFSNLLHFSFGLLFFFGWRGGCTGSFMTMVGLLPLSAVLTSPAKKRAVLISCTAVRAAKSQHRLWGIDFLLRDADTDGCVPCATHARSCSSDRPVPPV